MLKNYSLAVYDYQDNKMINLSAYNISIQGDAYNINYHRETNGYKELTFNVPAKIQDQNNNLIDNFRLDYLKNEYPVKLHIKNETHDFIIKKVQKQRTDNGVIFYEVKCVHKAFDRLSKSGIDLYFDEEIGSAEELLTQVLKNSDWSIGVLDEFKEDGQIKIRTLKGERSNRYSLIQEICALFEGFPVFHTDTKKVDIRQEIGLDRGVQFRWSKNLKNITQILESDEVITKLWVEGGDSSEHGLTLIESENPTGENYILNFQYYKDLGLLTTEQSIAITQFEANITQANQQINTLLQSLNDKALDVLIKESEKEGKDISVIAKQQTIDELNQKIAVEKNATIKQQLMNQRNTLQTEVNTLKSQIASLNSTINTLNTQITQAEANLKSALDAKDSLNRNFELALGDFIHEGIYQNTNYVDSVALYKDSLKVAERMSFPRVSYECNVLDLSRLTGYSLEEFDDGDKVYIVDETLNINTHGRITEIDDILDSPKDTNIKISNFDTKVEDLLNKIITASTIINSRKEIYDRAQGINANGTLNYDLLQKTFDSNAFQVKFGTNNNVITDNLGITIIDLFDDNKYVRINAGGIFITSDGGVSWKQAVSADGISALNIVSGLLDTKQLQIWNSDSPKFFWNEDGIFAYGVNDSQWIRFNEDGLYFTRNNGQSFDMIFNWNGLAMIGSTYKFDSTDFELKDNNNQVLITPLGILDTNNITQTDNVASGYPLSMRFYVDDQVNTVDKVYLRLTNEKFRAYSTGASSGGGSTSGSSSATTTASGGATTSGSSSATTTASGGATTSGSSSSSTTSSGGSSSPTSGASSSSTTSSGGSYSSSTGSMWDGTGYPAARTATEEGPGAHTHIIYKSEFAHSHSFSVGSHRHSMPHTHTVSIGDHSHGMAHTHSIGDHSHGMAHTHSIGSHSHNMAHTHTTPNHTHGIAYGIYENAVPSNAVTIYVDGVQRATTSTADASVNLSSWITTKGWHTVELRSTVLKRISAGLFIKSYIKR